MRKHNGFSALVWNLERNRPWLKSQSVDKNCFHEIQICVSCDAVFFLEFVICINIQFFFCVQLDPLFNILCVQKKNECVPGRNDALWIHLWSKLWSLQLWTHFKQLGPEKVRTSTGFESVTSRYRCELWSYWLSVADCQRHSNQLSYEATDSQWLHSSDRYREVMGSNPVEVLTFFRVLCAIA